VWWVIQNAGAATEQRLTPGGLAVLPASESEFPGGLICGDAEGVRLRLEHARLKLLRGFEELLCLEGLKGVEQLPHQVETVRKVLRHFRGRVLLADEVGLGKTIEACLLLREFVLRGMVKRVLILTPAALTGQWQEELAGKFGLSFTIPPTTAGPDFWGKHDRILASLNLAKGRKHSAAVTAEHWDLVIVDEAHHCKSRSTQNWQLVNELQRRHLFLLTATPVQNNLVELYNLLTLLEPGHLKTESDFKRTYVTRGNPRDPRNRERLRTLLSEVMIRNTRSLVHLGLPPRYAHTMEAQPGEHEARLYRHLDAYLRWRLPAEVASQREVAVESSDVLARIDDTGVVMAENEGDGAEPRKNAKGLKPLNRMQVTMMLLAAGSHPLALAPAIRRLAEEDQRAAPLVEALGRIGRSAKEERLFELLRQNRSDKTIIFANFRATIGRLSRSLEDAGIRHSVFSGEQSLVEKQLAVDQFRHEVPVMICSDSGGEGHNLQFANTLINFDLPWNPMRIEQRVGRVHRIGQTREVFVFNLCTAGSLEQRVLRVLNDKIRMFELVVGEVGSILGNLEQGEEFESLVLNLWMKSRTAGEMDAAFEGLGESLVAAQEEYVRSKELDEALFGEDYQ
jgi:SNF2 family DNA or RNA helicase